MRICLRARADRFEPCILVYEPRADPPFSSVLFFTRPLHCAFLKEVVLARAADLYLSGTRQVE